MQKLVTILLFFCFVTYNFDIGYGQNIFNVLNFGAIGDGKTDDSQVKSC